MPAMQGSMKQQRRSGFGNTNSPDFWRDALPQLGASRCAARGETACDLRGRRRALRRGGRFCPGLLCRGRRLRRHGCGRSGKYPAAPGEGRVRPAGGLYDGAGAWLYAPVPPGGRLDHALANLQLLETARADGVEAILLDPDNRVTCIGPGKYVLPRTEYFYFSLLPIDAVLRGVTIEGAKYPLCDAEARRGDSLTISNEWIEPTVRLRIREGLCWLICSGAAAR